MSVDRLAYLNSQQYINDDLAQLIQRALEEDVQTGDISSLATISPSVMAEARFLAKMDGVVAGLSVAEKVLLTVDPELSIRWTIADGARVKRGTEFGFVTGRAHSLLKAERLTLNLLQRMSGVATATRQMVDAVGPYKAKILDTRKTAPGLRVVDKLAVKLGGGTNHRMGLYDMVMIKDNHIEAAGGLTPALKVVHKYLQEKDLKGKVPIEVECRTLEEVKEALAFKPDEIDRLMLDNMVKVVYIVDKGDSSIKVKVDTSMLESALQLLGGKFKTEASGNVTLETVHAIAATGVDYISSGSLTHSVVALDISMKIKNITKSVPESEDPYFLNRHKKKVLDKKKGALTQSRL